MPQASSKELEIRSKQYNKTMDKYTLNEIENNSPLTDTHPEQTYNPSDHINILPNTENERRMALVIGNSDYANYGDLPNPVNDANAMVKLLYELKFKVIKYENTNQTTMKKAIDNFGKSLKGYDTGLFFYAGHGVQVKGINYLVPADADIHSATDVEYKCVQAGRILSRMEDADCKTNIIILDACRNNPFKENWNLTRNISQNGHGLAFMNAPSGSIIAYSTSPGRVALDGVSGTNGVYTSALLYHMRTSNIPIEEMFKRVRVTVEKQTNKMQTPWEATSLTGNFFFKTQR